MLCLSEMIESSLELDYNRRPSIELFAKPEELRVRFLSFVVLDVPSVNPHLRSRPLNMESAFESVGNGHVAIRGIRMFLAVNQLFWMPASAWYGAETILDSIFHHNVKRMEALRTGRQVLEP